MSSEVDSFLTDIFRSPSSASFPGFYLLLTIVTIILISGPKQVFASHDLTINRMQHYDIERVPHGSRNSIVNLDLTTLSTLSRSFAKKCVLIHLVDLINSTDTYKSLLTEPSVGGMLILVPRSFKSFSSALRSKVIEMENFMVSQVIDIPVYFVHEEPQLLSVYDEIISLSTSKSHGSNYGKFFESLTKSGYKLFTHASPAKAISAPILTNVEATLLGRGIEDQLPTIMFTAHYDSFGVSPGLSFGSDSNASGMIALLELCRLFSKLYSDRRSHPAMNLVFLLTAAGKFNYLGSKKWMEEQDHSKNKIVNDPQLTISLDSLGHQINSDQIFAHVSKAPKENSQGALFIKNLIEMAELKKTNASMVRKKINLANEVLDWEHEKFTIRRMPALTVSSLPGPRSEWRTSITDTAERIDVETLSRNIELIAESLARLVFKLEDNSGSFIFREDLAVSRSTVNSLINQFSSQSRAQQVLLTSSSGSSKYKVSPLLSTLSSILKRYTKNTRFQHHKLDEREPEVVFYDQNIVNVSIYNVKPAIFDFLLSIAISFYLGNLYLFLNYFSVIQSLVQSLKFKTSAQNGVAMTKSKVQ